jgi:hypothetical protein
MRIHYRYIPETCSFRIGAKGSNGLDYHEVQLQSWMDVEDVIKALSYCEDNIT